MPVPPPNVHIRNAPNQAAVEKTLNDWVLHHIKNKFINRKNYTFFFLNAIV